MDIEQVRAYCLSFPHVTENVQWGNDLVFKIAGKMFAVTVLESAPHCLSFKCAPEKFAELIEREGVEPAPYVARYHWVALRCAQREAIEGPATECLRIGFGEITEESASPARQVNIVIRAPSDWPFYLRFYR